MVAQSGPLEWEGSHEHLVRGQAVLGERGETSGVVTSINAIQHRDASGCLDGEGVESCWGVPWRSQRQALPFEWPLWSPRCCRRSTGEPIRPPAHRLQRSRRRNLTEIICLDGAVCNGNRICRNGNPGVLAHSRRRDALYGVGGVRIHALYGSGAAGDGGGFIKAAGVVASDGPAGYRRLRLIPG